LHDYFFALPSSATSALLCLLCAEHISKACIPKCIQTLVDDKVGAQDLQQRSCGEASHATGMADAAGCKDWDADEVTGQGLNVLGYL